MSDDAPLAPTPVEAVDSDPTPKGLSVGKLIGLLVLWSFAPVFLEATRVAESFGVPDQGEANKLVYSELIGITIVAAAITVLRWWPVVLVERRRLGRWVWIVPVTMLTVSIGFVNFGLLSDGGIVLALTTLVGALMIGVSEELMFRGVVLEFFRERFPEHRAAVFTTLMFGLFHGFGGPVHIVASAMVGYLLYLTLRVSGTIVLPIIVHGLADFSVFSDFTTKHGDTGSTSSVVQVLVQFALLIVVLVGRKHIWTTDRDPDATGDDVVSPVPGTDLGPAT